MDLGGQNFSSSRVQEEEQITSLIPHLWVKTIRADSQNTSQRPVIFCYVFAVLRFLDYPGPFMIGFLNFFKNFGVLSGPRSNGGIAHCGPRGLNHSYPGPRTNHNHSHNHNHVHSHSLNVSTLSTSKHSLGGGSSVGPPSKIANGGLHISANYDAFTTNRSPVPPASPQQTPEARISQTPGVREMLTSLGLLCLVSLLLALLSLIFLLRISPVTAADVRELLRVEQLTLISPEEYVIVYEVTLALCALSLSLNLCCVLVCAVQFLFAVKLVRDSPGGER
ncbi:hypothetical protein J6590_015005 [Homalodisca vitripennis]|nr:hypothetical protein J6590_015005 [Homalodisca vitripennis]